MLHWLCLQGASKFARYFERLKIDVLILDIIDLIWWLSAGPFESILCSFTVP